EQDFFEEVFGELRPGAIDCADQGVTDRRTREPTRATQVDAIGVALPGHALLVDIELPVLDEMTEVGAVAHGSSLPEPSRADGHGSRARAGADAQASDAPGQELEDRRDRDAGAAVEVDPERLVDDRRAGDVHMHPALALVELLEE